MRFHMIAIVSVFVSVVVSILALTRGALAQSAEQASPGAALRNRPHRHRTTSYANIRTGSRRKAYLTGRVRAVSYFRMGGMPVSACHNQHHNELRQRPLRLAACFAKSR